MDELLQVFDDNGKPTQSLPRSAIKADPRIYWHGVSNIWIKNKEGKLLITKRAPSVKSNGNKWQTYVGGHVKSGRTHEETAIDELHEEIGLRVEPTDLIFVRQEMNRKWMSFFKTYLLNYDGTQEITFNDGEIIESRWMKVDEYLKDLQENPDNWCNIIPEQDLDQLR